VNVSVDERARRATRTRCYLLYAIAPDRIRVAEANRIFNEFVGDRSLPLAIFHDHFIGRAGGVAIFYVGDPRERDALLAATNLAGWRVEIHPMVFSRSPSAFDEQIAFTLRQYRGVNWGSLRIEMRPSYGNPAREAKAAREEQGGAR
jgi:hypothetical protein